MIEGYCFNYTLLGRDFVSSFVSKYFVQIVNFCVPLGIGTIIILLSNMIKDKSTTLYKYGLLVGIIISLLSGILILQGIMGVLANIF